MHIGIDCRMWGQGFGIGRYISELITHILKEPPTHTYTLFFDATFSKQAYDNVALPTHAHKVLVDAPHYTVREQTSFVRALVRTRCDLMHFPHFNVPLACRKPYIVTIHDMTHHKFPGRKKSRVFHRIAYRGIFAHAVRHAQHVIAVSQSTQDELTGYFGKLPPTTVIAEGVSERFMPQSTDGIRQVNQKYGIVEPYMLFVGEWRRYKNIPFLIAAFELLLTQHPDMRLVLAGKPDPWYPEIMRAVAASPAVRAIHTPGFVDEGDLPALYSGARLFALPTRYEGFGLIVLEALACGTPALVSPLAALKELRAEELHFAPTTNHRTFADALHRFLTVKHKDRAQRTAGNIVQTYAWGRAARATIALYDLYDVA